MADCWKLFLFQRWRSLQFVFTSLPLLQLSVFERGKQKTEELHKQIDRQILHEWLC